MESPNKRRLIGIPRVSSSRQVKQGDSPDSQIRRFKEWCPANNSELVDIWKDDIGKSATIKEDKFSIILKANKLTVSYDLTPRPAILRALENADSKDWDGFLIYKWDRIFRDPPFAKAVQKYLAKFGKVIIPTDDPEDPFASDIIQVVNKYEIDKMKARVRSTRLNQFERGLPVGRCPVGYLFIFKNKRDRKGVIGIKIEPKKSEMIKDIFLMTSLDNGYKKICDKWKLKPQTYYNIIKNKIYIGIVEFESKEKKGINEPLVSNEIFYKINSNLK